MLLHCAELVEWARSKGLKELLPGMLLEESFADGRLLCHLVGLLERNTLSGIEWRSPSVAASRHNVTKVSFAFVCTIPICYIWLRCMNVYLRCFADCRLCQC